MSTDAEGRADARRGNAGTGSTAADDWVEESDELTDSRPIFLGNEFAEVRVQKVHTRNGVRLEISAPRLGYSVRLCPLELESLTWQTNESLSLLLEHPLGVGVDSGRP
jgi:hypothetical protein